MCSVRVGVFREKMYEPKLKYVFAASRLYDLRQNLPLFKYLNRLGHRVRILVGDDSVSESLKEQGVNFERLDCLPGDHDAIISRGLGLIPFDRYWLEKNMTAGKLNICNPLFLNPCKAKFRPLEREFSRLGHIICTSDGITLENTRSYNDDMVYLNTGHPEWDFFNSEKHRREVQEVKDRYGDKLCVLALPIFDVPRENDYTARCIRIGESMGYNVVIQIHPGFANKLDPVLHGYVNPGFRNFALFEAASHVVTFVYSFVVMECLNFETKVGCLPYAARYTSPNDHPWLDDDGLWYSWVEEKYPREFVGLLERIDSDERIEEFLSDSRAALTRKQFRELVRMPDVPSFTENVFREIDNLVSSPDDPRIEKMIRKTERVVGTEADFASWVTEKNKDAGIGAKCYEDFFSAGQQVLRQGNFQQALGFLDRAVMYSGNNDFDYLQYLRAICHFKLGKIFQAQRCIGQALMVKPDCEDYLMVKNTIDRSLPVDYSVLEESKKFQHTL